MDTEMQIRVNAAPWGGGVELLIMEPASGGLVSVGTNITMVTQAKDLWMEPTARISMTAAQVLMDDLWNAGLRPTEGTGSAGSLRATEKHLQDMRVIAFKELGIEGAK